MKPLEVLRELSTRINENNIDKIAVLSGMTKNDIVGIQRGHGQSLSVYDFNKIWLAIESLTGDV